MAPKDEKQYAIKKIIEGLQKHFAKDRATPLLASLQKHRAKTLEVFTDDFQKAVTGETGLDVRVVEELLALSETLMNAHIESNGGVTWVNTQKLSN